MASQGPTGASARVALRSPVVLAAAAHDGPALERALAARAWPAQTLRAAAGLLLADACPPAQARPLIQLLLAHGLSPAAVPKVAAVGSREHPDPAHQGSVLYTRVGSPPSPGDWGLPLAARATFRDSDLLEDLLTAGADPQQGVGESAFGSAWACAAAAVGTDLGCRALVVLERRAPQPWTEATCREVIRQLVVPGWRPVGQVADEGNAIRNFWVRTAAWRPLPLVPALPWHLWNAHPKSRERLGEWLLGTSGVEWEGLAASAREAGWDLRGLAVDLGLNGDDRLWHHAQRQRSAPEPVEWAKAEFDVPGAPGTARSLQSEPVDAVGYLQYAAHWPAWSASTAAHAQRWLARLEAEPSLPAVYTPSQRWALNIGRRGAPLAWWAGQPQWWVPHPQTGQTAAHVAVRPGKLFKAWPVLGPLLNACVVDGQGQQAGASVLAHAAMSRVDVELAEAALDNGTLAPSGQAWGWPASAWAALAPDLKEAFDRAVARGGPKGHLRARRLWALHAAAFRMAVPDVRRALVGSEAPCRRLDGLGRTPVCWWARAHAPERWEGTPHGPWQDRARNVFRLLVEKGPLWVPGQTEHPAAVLLFHRRRWADPQHWPQDCLDELAHDLATRWGDPAVRAAVWPDLQSAWRAGAGANEERLWQLLRLPPFLQAQLLAEILDDGAAAGAPCIPDARLVNTLEIWARLGQPLDPRCWEPDRVAAWAAAPGLRSLERFWRHPPIASAVTSAGFTHHWPEVPSPTGPRRRF